MKLKFLSVALGVVLSATAITASAQKAYTEGVVSYTATAGGQTVDSKLYFKGDSSSTGGQRGPATFKTIMAKGGDYLAILIDVPIANMKKAAIGTPAELESFKDQEPQFTFTPSTEAKVINGFNCTKVTVKDAKSGQSYEAWVTKDVTVPVNLITKYFAAAGGFPIQFTTMQMGQPLSIVIKSISGDKVPAGTFSIPAGYDKITITDLNALSGGH
ncbi:DUF4412 domain-containing protein [Mucilaginibacter polytrichastri]|uniref:Uncharacterized protein n=1 Tax=Mucilaginibacter polytrichastri TaxID=1302689 RepID=A0A1Q5ZYE9_9SPHI|nr:DUF4412 domain-containing protein [Mucilaginibacter polytrichastri]OKS86769.1 hypothetical protein RG47T_2226 [Mucilaginibacter polytrichastri]SFT22532.1 GLPGLI family protein [Mucilaginibacter polytrichastri]